MPLHRVIDLAILVCRSKQYFREAYRYPKLYDEKNKDIDRIALQGDAMNVSVCLDDPKIDEEIDLFRDALAKDVKIFLIS